MSMIKHFRDESGHTPTSYHKQFLERAKQDKARLKQLIARYKTAKPNEASKLLVSIHKIIDKYM